MRRQLAIGVVIALAAMFAYAEFTRLAGAQTARIYFDTEAYLEIARQPLGVDHLFYAKPPIVPLIYRASSDPATLRAIQISIALVAWTCFGFALGLALRRWWLRAFAGLVTIAILLAAPRVGWTGALLSESIGDSLLALVIAGGLALVTRPRRTVAIATGVVGLAWIFTRDTNAITVLVGVATAAIVWRRWWRGAIALATIGCIAAIVTLWATRVPRPLPYQASWNPALTSRSAYPMIDNLLGRVLPDDPAWLAERGAPIDAMRRFIDPDKFVQRAADPESQTWFLANGTSTYLRWLVRHPIDRAVELATDWVAVLAAHHTASMPLGWVASDGDVLRRLTTNRWIVLALVLAAPIWLVWGRRDARMKLATALVVGGLVGTAAAYYGDAAERSRHCFGSSQQLIVGAILALLVWLDRPTPQ